MAAKRRRKKSSDSNSSNGEDASPTLFRSLATAIASSQGSQRPIMKSLCYLLVHLSLGQPTCRGPHCDTVSHSLNIKPGGEEVQLNFEDVRCLSDVLFTELDRRFKEIFSSLCKQNDGPSLTHPDAQEMIEEVTLLLRCCINIMTLLMSCQEMAVEKIQALLSILSRLISAEPRIGNSSFQVTKSVSCEYLGKIDGHATSIAGDFVSSIYISEPSDPCHMFLCTVLEVFMDELLMNKLIRDMLLLVDSAFSSSKLFSTRVIGWFDFASVLEVISAHFIFSLSDEKMIEIFSSRVFWKQQNDFRTPQISLNAAVSLLLSPVMFSAPKMFHAYVVLLVSDAIGISASPRCKALDLQLINCYLGAFERSVVLYTRHMCCYNKAGKNTNENASSGKFSVSESNSQVAFEYLLLPSTLERVNHLIKKLNDSWGSYLSNLSAREDAELVASSVAYAKESLCVFDSSCSEERLSQILSILGCIILGACSDDVTDSVLQKGNETSTQDLFFLASTLKLMSCSMLQAVYCLKNGGSQLSSKATGDFPACKEYKAMMDIVQRFEQFSVTLPGQRYLRDKMESRPLRHKKSIWMLMHLSGLLSLSYARKLDFLMKDSIFAMVVCLYLFILEDGDLEALGALVGQQSESSSSVSSGGSAASAKTLGAGVDRKSSQAVALKFQKIRTLYLGKTSGTGSERIGEADDPKNDLVPQNMDSAVGVQEETCNGESFLKCIVRKGDLDPSDIHDLEDFIVCEPGKDYLDWLKSRARFRERWKSEKMATFRWKEKKKAWRECKRKIT